MALEIRTWRLQAVMVVVVMVGVVGAQSPSRPPPPAPQTDDAPATPNALLTEEACPPAIPVSNFNATEFSGRWYKFGGLPNLQEYTENCTVYDYTYTGSGFDVVERGVNERGERVSHKSSLTQEKASEGELVATVDGLEARLKVLATDYTSMACLYTCHNVRGTHRAHLAWILARDTSLLPAKIAACQVKLREVKVPLLHLVKTNHGPQC